MVTPPGQNKMISNLDRIYEKLKDLEVELKIEFSEIIVPKLNFEEVGTWLGIKRKSLIFIRNEPYKDLIVWINILTSQYIVRVLHTTR